jgi:polysaccharide export outer membrane protein
LRPLRLQGKDDNMKKMKYILIITLIIMASMQCGGRSAMTKGLIEIPSPQGGEGPQTIPSPLKGEGKGEGDMYLIERGDLLEIVILGEEELSRTLMVMHNGTISFPLIGEVKVAGLTTEQAVELLVEKLKKYFTQPVVSIIFKSPTLPYVSVFGEVLRQGAVEYQRGLRVSDYIALAGGPGSRANLGKVKVVRFQQGIPVATIINVNDIINKGLMENNFELKSGDWIQVSRKFTINWGAVLQFATLTLTALNLYITIDRLNE